MSKTCPNCGRPMVKRIAKKGPHAGERFWGCSGFPVCKCIVNIDDSDDLSLSSVGNISEKTIAPTKPIEKIKYEALPYAGFKHMASFNSIGVGEIVISALKSEVLDETNIRRYSKFRVDYDSDEHGNLSYKQRQIASVILRLLCRGNITRISPLVEKNIYEKVGYDNSWGSSVSSANLCVKKNIGLNFDSDLEEYFANTVLRKAIGPDWQNYVETQVYISSLIPDGDDFVNQRVDFLVSDGNTNLVIELDGEEHSDQIEKDAARDEALLGAGYSVFRIPNSDVNEDADNIINTIRDELDVATMRAYSFSEHTIAVMTCKLIHQAEVAIVNGLVNGAIAGNESLKVEFPDYIKNQSELNRLIFNDLSELFSNYCRLYDEPKFFESHYCNDAKDLICFAEKNNGTSCVALITDVVINKTINNIISGYIDLRIKDAPEDILLYFLKYIFRFDEFREGQFIALNRLLEGKDSIVLLPTGSGKSLIYQLGSLLVPGKIIVVEPLVALMEDQIFNLHEMGIDCAVYLSSGNTDSVDEISNPAISMIYVSPERLQIKGFRDKIDSLQINNRIYTVAIDEAHCVSEWGHDFRTAYLNIGRTTRAVFNFNGHRPTLIALTGTASSAVLKDVKRELEIDEYDATITPETFNRAELHFKVVKSNSDSKGEKLKELLDHTIPDYFGKSQSSFYQINADQTNGGIIFCPHANGDYGVVSAANVVGNSNISNDVYAGQKLKESGIENWDEYKKQSAKKFKQNKINTLISTKAFGMGIDKPNVRYTIHYGIPSSIESFYQEAGRAGRGSNINNALCTIIVSDDNSREDDLLLNPITGLEEIKNIIDNQKYGERDDVSRMLWFHIQSFKGIDYEMGCVRNVIRNLQQGGNLARTQITIKYGSGTLFDSLESLQKAIQRLLVLGVIQDYTVDYTQKEINLIPGYAEKDEIAKKYANYVRGYNEGRVAQEVRKINEINDVSTEELLYKSAEILTRFIYDTIEKGRRRGLSEIRTAALKAMQSDNPDEELRQRIIRYFETTYADELNLIMDDSNSGFELIPEILDGREIAESGEMAGGIRSCSEASGLRGGASRFLESTPDHPGLLATRALAELLCKDYEIESIKTDIKASCKYALTRYSYSEQKLSKFLNYFFRKVLERDSELFYPLLEEINEYCDVIDLCDYIISSTNIGEEAKAKAAELYFGDLAKRCSDKIVAMKGE